MTTLFTANTPWTLFCAQALRVGPYADDSARLLVLLKGDAPVFREMLERLLVREIWESVEIIEGRHLSGRFSQILPAAGMRLVPGTARRRIAAELAALDDILTTAKPTRLVLSNKWHAPEGYLHLRARELGVPVGLVEEGLSVYLERQYWDGGVIPRLARRAAYAWQGVRRLYDPSGRRFDFGWLSLPEAYPHDDITERRALFSEMSGFAKVARHLHRQNALASVVAELEEGAPLVLSQRLSEDGLVTGEEESAAWRLAVESLLERYAVVYFKPHPRDAEEKWAPLARRFGEHHVRFLGLQHYPIEALLFFWRPALLVGFLSGTLVYARAMFSLPCYTIADLLPVRTRGMSAFVGARRLCTPFRLEPVSSHPAARG